MTRRGAALLGWIAAGGCAAAPVTPATRSDPGLNAWVLEVVRGYPTDGSHGYHWPNAAESDWEGTTRPVEYGGRALTQGDPERRSYCCGLTFEVYVRALVLAGGGPAPGVTADALHELRLRFFGDSDAGERRRLVQFGLTSLGLGVAVERLEDARAGDFVQFWRHSGSGHQAVFVNWVWDGEQIVGLTYWSSQPSTRGIGYRTEWIGPAGVDPAAIHLARADWPLRDRAGTER